MRNYRLRSKKRKGLWRTKEASLASIIFPGVSPKEYQESEDIVMYANLVKSRRAQIPVEFYDLPVCQPPFLKSNRGFHTLSALLQGHDDNPQAPFPLKVKQDKGCTPLCLVSLSPERRSKELCHLRVSCGIQGTLSYTGLKNDEFYLYNHLRFTITYREDPSTFEGVRIIGFDVNPVSIHHDVQTDELTSSTKISTCNGEDAPDVVNNPSTYMPLRTSFYGGDFKVLYSYEVQWVASDLPWADRWMSTFLYGRMTTLTTSSWSASHECAYPHRCHRNHYDRTSVRTSLHLTRCKPSRKVTTKLDGRWSAVMSSDPFHMANDAVLIALNKEQTLTTILGLYLLSGSVAGYISARLYKFCEAKASKMNIVYTAIALSASHVAIFAVLNIVRFSAGSSAFVAFVTSFRFCSLVLRFRPFVFVGSYFGHRADKIQVPVKTEQVARVVPDNVPWHVNPCITVVLGGVLPFASVSSEMANVMPALWLNQPFFVVRSLLLVMLILTATCAQVAVATTYLQLRSEDHRWWWKSFWNCASAGVYLCSTRYGSCCSQDLSWWSLAVRCVYDLYDHDFRLLWTLLFGGSFASFWFNRIIYGAVKVD
ncbi:Nonaspanin (TM9SF) [Fragilaria crotonensis]|nr:Nonaspanin (TM9SF) [Fragilaria crotonensis]